MVCRELEVQANEGRIFGDCAPAAVVLERGEKFEMSCDHTTAAWVEEGVGLPISLL